MSIVIIICITTTVIFYQSYALNSVIIIITLQPEKANADILTTKVPIELHERWMVMKMIMLLYYLSIHSFKPLINLPMHPFIHVDQSIHPPIGQSIHPCIHSCMHLFIDEFITWSIFDDKAEHNSLTPSVSLVMERRP